MILMIKIQLFPNIKIINGIHLTKTILISIGYNQNLK